MTQADREWVEAGLGAEGVRVEATGEQANQVLPACLSSFHSQTALGSPAPAASSPSPLPVSGVIAAGSTGLDAVASRALIHMAADTMRMPVAWAG